MENPLLQKVVQNLRIRRDELLRWLGQSTGNEVQLRLGSHPPDAVRSEVAVLDAMIDKGEHSELGRCVVCKEEVDSSLFEMDYTACVCLEHLNAEQRNRLESELELSVKVQRALLPQSPPALPGWEVAAFSQPASVVGGDYFDFLRFGDHSHAIILADVMGKGMPASMLVANLQASLRIIVPESNSPRDVVLRLNRLFMHNIRLTKFVSLFIGHLDPETGVMAYVNAGHHPPLVVRNSGGGNAEAELLRPTGPAIGLVEEPQYEEKMATVESGGGLVLYTDGIVELRDTNGTEFGDERLAEIVLRTSDRSAAERVQEVRTQLRAHAGRTTFDDDATMIAYRRIAR